MSTEEELAALRIRYARLHRAAQAAVDGVRPAESNRPLCVLELHIVRTLRRELAGEVQPHSKLACMSPT
jgi:hypothetical protein